MPALHIDIAGGRIALDQAVTALSSYLAETGTTVSRYDQPGPGDQFKLTKQEVERTRVIKSRISDEQLKWFLMQADNAPWPPRDADLRLADPAVEGGLYDQLSACYMHFLDNRPPGVKDGKISKVLHIKRPRAFPILDQRVRDCYQAAAHQAAKKYKARGYRSFWWGAIYDDLVANTNSGALDALRKAMRKSGELDVFRELSDLRLLDILTWREN